MTIKSRILIPMVILVLVCTSAILTSTVFLFNNYINRTIHDKIESAFSVADNEFLLRKQKSHNAATEIANNLSFMEALENEDRERLISVSRNLQSILGVDFMTITDADGIVVLRTHEPDNFGDSVTSQANVRAAMAGNILTAVEMGTAVKLSIRSGAPVYGSNNNIIGVVSVGYRMDKDNFVDSLKALTNCETTIFLKDERLATTILQGDGTRAIGTAADAEVSEQVLSGAEYMGKVEILGETAITKYAPIYSLDGDTSAGNIVGMLFVGQYTKQEMQTIFSFIGNGLIISIIVMAAGILTVFGVSKNIEKQIGHIVGGLKVSSERIETSTKGLTEISASLADGSSRQAASIEETSATMNEFASIISQNAENARDAADLAQKSQRSADTGKEKMKEMIESMNQLKESSDVISMIIKTIDDIAFQTNLLAVNATIEAGRAGGEAGRSFAVVADEVRNLAKKSADAAANTTDIIEQNIALTNEGRKISIDIAHALEKITSESTDLNRIIQEIDLASQEQSKGISQINIAVSQMEKITQENAAMAQETTESSQDLQKEIQSLESIVDESLKLIQKNNSHD